MIRLSACAVWVLLDPNVEVGLKLGAMLFGAGVAYGGYLGLKKAVNGIGRKVGKIILFLQESVPEDRRKRLTDILKD